MILQMTVNFCKIFVDENNFAVTDLDVSPGSVIRANVNIIITIVKKVPIIK